MRSTQQAEVALWWGPNTPHTPRQWEADHVTCTHLIITTVQRSFIEMAHKYWKALPGNISKGLLIPSSWGTRVWHLQDQELDIELIEKSCERWILTRNPSLPGPVSCSTFLYFRHTVSILPKLVTWHGAPAQCFSICLLSSWLWPPPPGALQLLSERSQTSSVRENRGEGAMSQDKNEACWREGEKGMG